MTDQHAFEPRPIVLYVEDHAVNLLLMKALFERRPAFDLVCATSGFGAMTLARTLEPALLLLDLRLPDCHGEQLLHRLRALPACRDIPAVAVTADSDFDIHGTGFAELWAKPLHLPSVLQRLDAWMAPVQARTDPRQEPSVRRSPPPVPAHPGHGAHA